MGVLARSRDARSFPRVSIRRCRRDVSRRLRSYTRFARAFRTAHPLTFRTPRDGMSELTSKLDIARPVERPTGVARNRDDSQRADD